MNANNGQCLNLISVSESNLACSYTDIHGQDASPSQVPSQQCCWEGTADEYNDMRQIVVNGIASASQTTMPGVAIEHMTLESYLSRRSRDMYRDTVCNNRDTRDLATFLRFYI